MMDICGELLSGGRPGSSHLTVPPVSKHPSSGSWQDPSDTHIQANPAEPPENFLCSGPCPEIWNTVGSEADPVPELMVV